MPRILFLSKQSIFFLHACNVVISRNLSLINPNFLWQMKWRQHKSTSDVTSPFTILVSPVCKQAKLYSLRPKEVECTHNGCYKHVRSLVTISWSVHLRYVDLMRALPAHTPEIVVIPFHSTRFKGAGWCTWSPLALLNSYTPAVN